MIVAKFINIYTSGEYIEVTHGKVKKEIKYRR